MLKKLTLAVAALAVSAACIGASSASAATLYKAASKVGGTVPVGETFTAKMPTFNPKDPSTLWYQKGGVPFTQECGEASISFKVTQNSGGVFKAAATAVAFPLCSPNPQTGKTYSLLPLEVSGSSISVGANSDWLGTKLSFGWGIVGYLPFEAAPFSSATGNPPTKGAYIQEPTEAKAPVSIVLDQAALTSPTGTTVTAKFTFTGTAAAWSFQ
jgi:hypothetical protein